MKQSEFDVVEQLKKTPASVSLLSLILTSDLHRKALLRVMKEAYVKNEITPECMINMVDPVKHASMITFSNEEITSQHEKHPKALHITLKCKGYIVAKVLIDGGSALNVLPKSTLAHLAMSEHDLSPQEMIVRAFDGTRRNILGEVVLPLEVGPSKFHALFQVIEIEPAYTMLLGRPWIHAAGAVPSTLHQMVKYINDGSVITIHGEEEIMVSKPVSVPYVENMEQVEGTMLHSFEVVESKPRKDEVPGQSVNQVIARIMAKNGFQEGRGLGSQLQGIQGPIALPENHRRYGLGYLSSLEEEMEGMALESKSKGKMKQVPHLREIFSTSAEMIIPGEDVRPKSRLTINMMDNKDIEICGSIHISKGGELLKNWQSEPVFDVISSK